MTHDIREEIIHSLEMFDCALISTSPDHPNIYYEVRSRTDIESDMADIVSSLQQHKNMIPRVSLLQVPSIVDDGIHITHIDAHS